ncbi:MAG: PilT/PilU family type 4a pilus ATPase [Phycisphaerales bacterium]|nr:PilT/PilU family type 4a pilus ATPase [Phycisphaerales bacterium]MCB9854256.1 PilT/PilU family type 4a pilus ATPase [Phycisphaerales bacterium]MCB9864736.1 PilT/PilU family type 4a pilus ATPase [Phycisphaerales bacterium]
MSEIPGAQQLLGAMQQHNASDLHLKAGNPPVYRIGGHLRPVHLPAMSGAQIDACLTPIIPGTRRGYYEEHGDLDFAYSLPDGDRFRINIFRAGGVMNAAIRRVNPYIPSYEELNLPPVFRTLIDESNEGIIIISGVTGSGKSTTLAAMIEQINDTRHENIVTIEDPVEYIFKSKKSIISQREIGIDIATYGEGLKYIVRQDPDVIFVGEMRDKFTMTSALQAAETGHLVFGTLHTADAMQAFARVLEFFPREEHDFIRSSLANSLRAICAQRLLPGAEEGKRVPATEVLVNSATCKDIIRKEQDEDIPALIEGSEKEGMHSFTTSLARLVQEELVFMDTAMEFAPNRDALAGRIRGIKTSTQSMIHRTK